MTNHAHLISSKAENLSGILRDLKRHTAKEVLRAIEEYAPQSRREWMRWLFERAGQRNAHNTKYQFWQQGNYPIELPSNDLRQQRLAYLHRNPLAMTWRPCLHCRNAANNVRAACSTSLAYRRVSLARQWRCNLHRLTSASYGCV